MASHPQPVSCLSYPNPTVFSHEMLLSKDLSDFQLLITEFQSNSPGVEEAAAVASRGQSHHVLLLRAGSTGLLNLKTVY